MGAYKADEDYDYLFKVVLIGDSGVGKGSPRMSSVTDPSPPSASSSLPEALVSNIRSLRPRFGTPPAKKVGRILVVSSGGALVIACLRSSL
ncbi:hypothetical protein K1719_036342 [Acacia pycnantha]|nr:hypothetical protein K1719_036342 [Acacia pycnantha]